MYVWVIREYGFCGVMVFKGSDVRNFQIACYDNHSELYVIELSMSKKVCQLGFCHALHLGHLSLLSKQAYHYLQPVGKQQIIIEGAEISLEDEGSLECLPTCWDWFGNVDIVAITKPVLLLQFSGLHHGIVDVLVGCTENIVGFDCQIEKFHDIHSVGTLQCPSSFKFV